MWLRYFRADKSVEPLLNPTVGGRLSSLLPDYKWRFQLPRERDARV